MWLLFYCSAAKYRIIKQTIPLCFFWQNFFRTGIDCLCLVETQEALKVQRLATLVSIHGYVLQQCFPHAPQSPLPPPLLHPHHHPHLRAVWVISGSYTVQAVPDFKVCLQKPVPLTQYILFPNPRREPISSLKRFFKICMLSFDLLFQEVYTVQQ